jgi:deazaflavin-dependent oxidoreductase (nitroreductase family)
MWLPGFGVVLHTGRRSKRQYRTPVNVFAAPGGYVVALTYGTDSDWVKNVLAAGGCDLVRGGRLAHLMAPEIVHDESRRQVPMVVRPMLRLLGVADFMRLANASPQA